MDGRIQRVLLKTQTRSQRKIPWRRLRRETSDKDEAEVQIVQVVYGECGVRSGMVLSSCRTQTIRNWQVQVKTKRNGECSQSANHVQKTT